MQYFLGFEYVSIAISAIMLFLFRGRQKARLPIYKTYYGMMLLALGASVFDILSVSIIGHEANLREGVVYLFNLLFLLALNTMPSLFIICLLFMVNIDFRESKAWEYLILMPMMLSLLLLITTPMTHFIFYVDENLVYQHGPGFLILMIILVYETIISAVAIIKYKKELGSAKIFYLVTCMVLVVLAQIFQILFPQYLTVSFATVLGMCVVIYMTQGPEEIFDGTDAMFVQSLFDSAAADYSMNKEFSLVLVKIHEFDLLVDSFGEDEINSLMRNVTAYFASLHPTASVYRMEESIYAIKVKRLMVNQDDIAEIHNQILYRFDVPWKNGNLEIVLPISIVSLKLPRDAKDSVEFRKLLDKVTRAKMPINAVWGVQELESVNKNEAIMKAVKRAVERNGFQVFYQPIYSTKEKEIIAAEALIRLFDPELGFISPEVFIPMAEKEGYILDIGRFVFQEVCRFFSKNKLEEKGLKYIEVNLSPVQCMQHELAEEFTKIMEENHISENQINFEITETSAMAINPVVTSNINRFVQHGIDFSLDDYGTGYSNLNYLSEMPFQYIKIDKSLLWSADNNEKADITLKNTVAMAKKLQMRTIVEGVETIEQVEKLLLLKVDYFQGYYFSKPVNGDNFMKYINAFENPEEIEKLGIIV